LRVNSGGHFTARNRAFDNLLDASSPRAYDLRSPSVDKLGMSPFMRQQSADHAHRGDAFVRLPDISQFGDEVSPDIARRRRPISMHVRDRRSHNGRFVAPPTVNGGFGYSTPLSDVGHRHPVETDLTEEFERRIEDGRLRVHPRTSSTRAVGGHRSPIRHNSAYPLYDPRRHDISYLIQAGAPQEPASASTATFHSQRRLNSALGLPQLNS
jgi:hypothetical protein